MRASIGASAGRILLYLSLASASQVLLPSPGVSQFLCSAGQRDGLDCQGDDDCPGGVCVIPLGVCAASGTEPEFCICPGSECAMEPICSEDESFGTCVGGVFQDFCCDLVFNCKDSACVSTQKICLGGDLKGFPCIVNANCYGSVCTSTGRYCSEGYNDSFTCVDDDDCPDGTCLGSVSLPTPTPTPCAGDCNGDGSVTVDELVVGVNLILEQIPISTCVQFDTTSDGRVTVDELTAGVRAVLEGCA